MYLLWALDVPALSVLLVSQEYAVFLRARQPSASPHLSTPPLSWKHFTRAPSAPCRTAGVLRGERGPWSPTVWCPFTQGSELPKVRAVGGHHFCVCLFLNPKLQAMCRTVHKKKPFSNFLSFFLSTLLDCVQWIWGMLPNCMLLFLLTKCSNCKHKLSVASTVYYNKQLPQNFLLIWILLCLFCFIENNPDLC